MIETVDALRAATEPDIPFRLILTSDEVVKLALEQLAESAGPLPVSDVSMVVRETLVELALSMSLMGMPVAVSLSGLPRVEDEAVQFDFAKLDLNGTPAPAFVRSQIVNQVNGRLAPERLPIVVEQIDLADGFVTIVGRTK